MPASAADHFREPSSPDAGRRLELPYQLIGLISLFLVALLIFLFLPNLLVARIVPELANKDFVNYWAAAHLAADGKIADIFGPQPPYFAHLAAMMGAGLSWHNWSYPPHYLLLMMPLSLVGYKAGIVLFLSATGLLFWTGLVAFMGRRPDRLTLVAVAPSIVVNLMMVQNGFLMTGLILWFMALRDRRPIVAGICLGIVTIKPQLALLLPILPLVERRWSVLLSAGVTTVALVAASTFAFGIGAWTGFIDNILPYQRLVMANLNGPWLTMVPSVFGAMRLLGWNAGTALLVHGLIACPVLILAALSPLFGRRTRLTEPLFLVSMFIVVPYTLSYDLGVVGAAIALFIRQEESVGRSFTGLQKIGLALTMALPLVMMDFGRFGIDVGPIALLGVFALMVKRAVLPEMSTDGSAARASLPRRQPASPARPSLTIRP